MNSLPPKSKLKYIAHNPTGELIRIFTEKIKTKKNIGYESNSRTNSK